MIQMPALDALPQALVSTHTINYKDLKQVQQQERTSSISSIVQDSNHLLRPISTAMSGAANKGPEARTGLVMPESSPGLLSGH